MTNSMNNMPEMVDELIKDVSSRYSVLHTDIVDTNQVAMDVDMLSVHSILAYLRGAGWDQLSILTCVDWIDEGQFQLVYILFNWDKPIRIQLRARISRDNAKVETIMHIYPGAKYYERDVHEFFGVEFEGNPDSMKQLFLENWDDLPPLRKDFDSKAYSDRKYTARTYKKDYNTDKPDSTKEVE
jgi:NADH-quinone oxidoreductase subunit C